MCVISRSRHDYCTVLGLSDKIGEGDTYLVANLLPPDRNSPRVRTVDEGSCAEHHASSRFVGLPIIPIAREDTMSPIGGEVPRLVAVHGEIEAGK
jgi:hypothetical protein